MIDIVRPRQQAPEPAAWLAGGGVVGALTRDKDWARTPVGPLADWPHSLKTTVGICLGSRHPMVVWWGREHLTQFYNDAYVSFLGRKHPGALGQSARECWREIWHIIDPMLEGVFSTGAATWSEDFLYVIDRNIPREEGYFTFSYSPIRDDTGAIGGIFCACTETTGRVIGERRLRTLRDLSRIDVQANAERSCEVAVGTLAANQADIPFALVYLLDDERRVARLVARAGLEAGDPAAPPAVDLDRADAPWPVGKVLREGTSALQRDVSAMLGAPPRGPWPEAPQAAQLAPIPAAGQAPPTGVLVCGLSPRRVIDADYRSFVNLIAEHIGTSIANGRAYAEERKRAEAAQTLLLRELNHRVRNTLANVQAIAQQTLRQTTDAREFVTTFAGRLQSLARAHSLVSNTALRGTDLAELLGSQLVVDAGDGRIDAGGPAVTFAAQTALHLALMLHELRTNATKYGALANAGGRVTIRWTIDADSLRLTWRESGGPAVARVRRRGFGTMLIEQSARAEGGSARMLADDDGVAWEIALAMPRAAPHADRVASLTNAPSSATR